MIDYQKLKNPTFYILLFFIFLCKSAYNFLKDYTEEYLGINSIEGVFDLNFFEIKKKMLPSSIFMFVIIILVRFINIDKFLHMLIINKYTGLKTNTKLNEEYL